MKSARRARDFTAPAESPRAIHRPRPPRVLSGWHRNSVVFPCGMCSDSSDIPLWSAKKRKSAHTRPQGAANRKSTPAGPAEPRNTLARAVKRSAGGLPAGGNLAGVNTRLAPFPALSRAPPSRQPRRRLQPHLRATAERNMATAPLDSP